MAIGLKERFVLQSEQVYYRVTSGHRGIYEAVESDCPRGDVRRKGKPDGAWLPKVGKDYPGAISLWTAAGMERYVESGLLEWHKTVVKKKPRVALVLLSGAVLYADPLQVICAVGAVVEKEEFVVDEFLARWDRERVNDD